MKNLAGDSETNERPRPAPRHVLQLRDAPVSSRAASARRLEPRPGGNPAVDRLASLASRLLASGSAQVSLLSDVQVVAGGAGLPAGSIGSRSPVEDSLCHVTAVSGAPLVVADAAADARVSNLPPVTSGAVGSYLGVPLTADDGHTVGAICVFDPTPRSWSEADIATLTQLAHSAVAELELSALGAEYESGQLLWGLALDAAGIGTFELDVASGVLTWDERLSEIFGYNPLTFDRSLAAFETRVHPEDLPRISRALQECIDTCGAYDAEYRIVLPDGQTRWVASKGRALADEEGKTARVIGAAHDTTGERNGEARVARVLESMTAGFLALDRDWRITYVNGEAERVLDMTRSELRGRTLWEAFPATVGSEFETNYRSAVDTGRPVTFEAFYPEPYQSWYEIRAWPNPDGLTLYFLDVSARRAAQDEARRATRHAALVAEVASELALTMDADDAVGRLARLVVPALGDWCIVSLVDSDDQPGSATGLRDVGWWHADPEQRALTGRYAVQRQRTLIDGSLVEQALSSGQPVTVHCGAAAELAAALFPGEVRDQLVELAPESAAIFPLRARGRTLGVLSVFNGRDRGGPTDDELATAKEVAARSGLALENVRLYSQQRRLAEELQRSLLSDPPQPDSMEIVVRYEPAVEAAQVGGDWYDAFVQPDGATVLVIGDVVGHDTAAAAAMGQVRSLLRGIAAHTGSGPAAVLCGVDQVLQTLRIETTATAVVARFEQSDDERAPSSTHLHWSNAGHPPPMVIHPDGSVVALTGIRADLLLGIEPATPRVQSDVMLDPGSTVLLYTDGLVERRGQSIDEGLDRLRGLLAELADRPLGELCDQVLARLLPHRPDDDVALVAIRLHVPVVSAAGWQGPPLPSRA